MIAAMDTSSGAQSVISAQGLNPTKMFLSPDGQTFFIVEGYTSVITAVDVASGKRKVTFHTTHEPYPNFLSTNPFAVAPDGSLIFVGTCAREGVGNCIAGFVEEFDTASGNEVGSVSFGANGVTGIAVAPDGTTAYVTQNGVKATAITAVTIPSLAIGKSLPLSNDPGLLVIDPTGSMAYVGSISSPAQVVAVNLPALTMANQVSVNGALEMALSANGAVLCVTDSVYFIGRLNDSITFLEVPSLSIIGTVTTAGFSEGGLAIDSVGQYAYVGNADNYAIYQVSSESLAISTTFATGAPLDLALSTDGQTVYPLWTPGSNISVFEEGKPLPSNVFPAPSPQSLAVSPGGRTLYDCLLDGNGVVAISASTGAPLMSFVPGFGVYNVAVSPDGSTLYVGAGQNAGADASVFFVLDAETGAVKNQITLGGNGPPFIALTPDGSTVLINDYQISPMVYDVGTGEIIHTIDVPGGGSVAIDPTGSFAYLQTGTSQLAVIDLADFSVTGYIDTPGYYLAFSPTAPIAYATDGVATIAVIDTQTQTVSGNIDGFASRLAVTADGRYLYGAGVFVDSYLPGVVVDTKSQAVIAPFLANYAVAIR
jgi:DNA-binding beta-propeller fold protein YncE